MPNAGPKRVPLLWALLPFTAGIALAYASPTAFSAATLALALPFALAGIFWSRSSASSHAAISLAALLSGYSYLSLLEDRSQPRPQMETREAELEIEIERVFRSTADPYARVNGIAAIALAEPHLSDLVGAQIAFSLESDIAPDIGARYQAKGLLSSINASEQNSFTNYLKSQRIAFRFSRGMLLEQTCSGSALSQSLRSMRRAMRDTLGIGLDPDNEYRSIYTAMLLGEKEHLSFEQRRRFLSSGVMHLFAISGLHIGVIAAAFHAFFFLLRTPQRWLALPALSGALFFTLVTGGAPSAWRAFAMIACLYLCRITRRQGAPFNALALSALICLLANPFQLMHAGFQMSYAAVAAILLYGVPLADLMNRWRPPFADLPQATWNWLHHLAFHTRRAVFSSFAISLAASIPSSLLGIHYFGLWPTLGVFVNILLLPLASLALIAGLCSLLCGTLWLGALCDLFNHAACLILWLGDSLLQRLPEGSALVLDDQQSATSALLFAIIALIALMAYGYDRSWKLSKLWLWAPPMLASSVCLAITVSG